MDRERHGSDLDLNSLLEDGLRELIDLVSGSGVTELRVERGETKLLIRSAPATPEGSAAPAVSAGLPAPQPAAQPTPTPEAAGVPITSPIVGSFFSAPSPDSEPFVEVGDYVEQGQTVGIIEAMKIMNEIESDSSGRVIEVLVQNGQAVEYGTELMRIDVTAPPPA